MRVNREKHHLLVLPEDDATRSIAIGFMKCVINQRAMQILPITDGWKKALDEFTNYQVAKMRDFPKLTHEKTECHTLLKGFQRT